MVCQRAVYCSDTCAHADLARHGPRCAAGDSTRTELAASFTRLRAAVDAGDGASALLEKQHRWEMTGQRTMGMRIHAELGFADWLGFQIKVLQLFAQAYALAHDAAHSSGRAKSMAFGCVITGQRLVALLGVRVEVARLTHDMATLAVARETHAMAMLEVADKSIIAASTGAIHWIDRARARPATPFRSLQVMRDAVDFVDFPNEQTALLIT